MHGMLETQRSLSMVAIMNKSAVPVAVGDLNTPEIFRVVLAKFKDPSSKHATLSRRESAQPLRRGIDSYLGTGAVVEVDCAGADATQSYMDELVGILVLERGPKVLDQLRFRGCSKDMKAIINFVVSDRAAQFIRNPHQHAPR
ncbi:STAS-like domain-containing protein [Delftia sp. DT-2]|uniref:STAS-like domain-containing protein n=1 Tax=Delftia sp. DT-2 TaxID=3022772 RepID=UPI003FA497E3